MRTSFRRGRRFGRHGRHETKARRVLRGVLAGCCALCLVCSASILVARAVDAAQTREINEENRQIMAASAQAEAVMTSAVTASPQAQTTAAPTPEVTATTPPELLPNAAQLLARNADYAGWLKVDCVSEIDFAITQRDNVYYLNHDFSGKENSNGTAFLDEMCSLLPRDDNLTIYGHNMRDGAMFGKLNRMTTLSRIMAAPFTTFSTCWEQDVYVPVAVMHCSIDPKASDYFVFSTNHFASENVFDQFIARAKELSLVALPYDARYGDKLLTLATCITQEDNMRLVVLLRAMRGDETREGLLAALS